ncbi:hypothetical protein H0E87_008430 [Populus deltoides]|uniref:KIB1-4 beta-propeller domain-containing protein n=1 Tax=Populus deltoides TaxID=3696 RepID=A0A8T2Z0I0_POPDE|nr:hypothetical protein H0E87_008430 [Populus deltoides]
MKVHQIPWLLIPPQEEDNEASNSTRLFSIEEGKFYGGRYIIEWVCASQEQDSEQQRMREHLIQKAILSSDSCHSDSFGVVLICRKSWKLAFCQCGGKRKSSWMYLDGKNAPYHDVMRSENKLHALGNCGSLERSLYLHILFGESAGTVLLVARCVGEFVLGGASPVLEEDLLIDEDIQPLVCPYWTLRFRLFRMDFEQKPWVDMETLEDRALFIGANHSASVSVSNCGGREQNSIYFTDDY